MVIKTGDPVNPDHYSRFETQPIDFITGSVGLGFIVGNIIKYTLRYDAKNGLEDVRKAQRYLEFLANVLEGRKPSDNG